MANKLKCPLCGGNVARHREDGCILAALIEVIRERDAISEQRLRKIHAHADVDAEGERDIYRGKSAINGGKCMGQPGRTARGM